MVAPNHRTGIEVNTTIKDFIDDLRSEGNRIGMVTGSFEIPHPGSLYMLRKAADHCDELIVCMWRDKTFQKIYGREPLFPETERAALIGFYKMVTAVIPYDVDDFGGMLELVSPDTLFVRGGDPVYLSPDNRYKVKIIEPYEPYNHNYIIHKLRSGSFFYDNCMQMWCYAMQGEGLPVLYHKTLSGLLKFLRVKYHMEF